MQENQLPEPKLDWINICVPFLKKKHGMSTRERTILHYYGVFFFSLSDLVLKIIPYAYPHNNVFPMTFFQGIAWVLIALFDIKNFGFEIPNFFELKERNIILLRALANCSTNIFITLAIYHIKFAIVISILFSNHLFNSVFSYFYFKEKFYTRYFYGLLLSFGGMLLFAFSCRDDNMDAINQSPRPFLGIFYAFLSSVSVSTVSILNKMLRHHQPCILNLYCGISGIALSFPFLFFVEKIEFSPGYIILNFLNSILFYGANTFFNISVVYNSLIFISSINFSSIVFAFLYGLVFFGENLIFEEFLGVLIIMSYNIWSIYKPIDEKH